MQVRLFLLTSSSCSKASPVKYNTALGTILSLIKCPISKSAAKRASRSSSWNQGEWHYWLPVDSCKKRTPLVFDVQNKGTTAQNTCVHITVTRIQNSRLLSPDNCQAQITASQHNLHFFPINTSTLNTFLYF